MLKSDVSVLAKEVELSSRVAGSEAEIGRNLPVSWIQRQAVRIIASDLGKKVDPPIPFLLPGFNALLQHQDFRRIYRNLGIVTVGTPLLVPIFSLRQQVRKGPQRNQKLWYHLCIIVDSEGPARI